MYVRQAFRLPARYASATEAWEKSGSKHRDRNFPAGVWTPVWYGIDVEPLGHVVLRSPDGTVYSTSDFSGWPVIHNSLADLEAFYAYYGMNLQYRGWTEDVAGYPVMESSNTTVQAQSVTPKKEWDELATKEEFQQLLWDMFEGKRLPAAIQKAVMNATAPSVDGSYWTLSAHLKGTAVRTVQVLKDVAALSGEVAAARNEIKQIAAKTGVALDTKQVEAAAEEGARKAIAAAQAVDAKLIADAVADEQAARMSQDVIK